MSQWRSYSEKSPIEVKRESERKQKPLSIDGLKHGEEIYLNYVLVVGQFHVHCWADETFAVDEF